MKKLLRWLMEKHEAGLFARVMEEWRWIAGYMRRYTRQITFYIVLGIIGILLGLAGSLMSKRLIDVVTGYDRGSIAGIVTLYVGVGLAGMAVGAVISRVSTKVQLRVHQEIRADVFNQVMMTEWEAVADYHSGDLLNRANGDTSTVASSVLGFLPSVVTSTVQFAAALAIILYFDPMMALLTLSSAPVLALSSRLLLRKMRAFQMESKKLSSEIMSFNNEAFHNVQFIKAFDLAGRFLERLKGLQQKSYDYTMRYNAFSIATSSALGLVGRAVSLLIFGWSVYRLWQGQISFGTMTLFLQLSGTLSGAFNALVGIIPSMVSSGTSARRVMDIVQLRSEDRTGDESASEFQKTAALHGVVLRLDDVDFTYHRGNTVFTGVRFIARPGEIVALVGPTGGGKTTLLRVMLGLVRVQAGQARVISAEHTGLSLPIGPSTRRLISYVPQGNMLFSGTIAENLRVVHPEATDTELLDALEAACIREEVLAMPEGLESKIGERGHGLSEGQSQRLSIARALLSQSPVFLLDEATSALDIATERQLLRNIMRKDMKKTIIVATHRPSVLDLCDRVYGVSGGRVDLMTDAEKEGMLAAF